MRSTPRYDRREHAPEQFAGEPITDAADQFGLGVTLVEVGFAQGSESPYDGEWQVVIPTGFSVDRAWVASHIMT